VNSALRRKQIVYAARQVFGRKGYHAATVEDILTEAGIARGTFYLHFKSKREVFGVLLGSLTSALEMNIKRVATAPDAPPVLDQMLGNVERILTILINNLDLTRIMLHEATGIDPDFDRKLGEFYDNVLALIQLSLKHGQEMKIVRDCDIEVASHVILGSVRQTMEIVLRSKKRPVSADALGRALLDLLAGGIFVKA
jgi:AcrR family transcriptional regulator